jgi:hypothetical protein
VTSLDESPLDNSHRWPVFLPDGIHFLYFVRSADDSRRGIYLGNVNVLGQPPGSRLIESDSDAVYVTLGADEEGALITVDPEGLRVQRFDAAARQLAGEPRLLDLRAGASSAHERAMFAASAATLATADRSFVRDSRLTSAARDGSDVRVWPEREIFNWPRLSPDGTRLVFQKIDQRRGTPDLWVRDLVRGTETRAIALTEQDERQSSRVEAVTARSLARAPPLRRTPGSRRRCP